MMNAHAEEQVAEGLQSVNFLGPAAVISYLFSNKNYIESANHCSKILDSFITLPECLIASQKRWKDQEAKLLFLNDITVSNSKVADCCADK